MRPRSVRCTGGLLALLVVAAPASRGARANVAEVFGFGSRQAALAGAVSARVDDYSAGYYNPAGLALGVRKAVALGLLGFASDLEVNDRAVEIAEPYGLLVGASTPAPLGGALKGRVTVGVAAFLIPKTLVRVIARQPDEPFYPLYDNRTQRLVLIPTVAVRASDRLSLGVGLNVLAFLEGAVVAAEGPTRAVEPRVDIEIGTRVRAHLGARLRLGARHAVALVYRQAFGVPFAIVTQNRVAGQPIDLDISAQGLYTPHQLVAGWAWQPRAITLSADVTLALWSLHPGAYVAVGSELPLVGPLRGELPEVPWKDTVGGRVGAEGRVVLGGVPVALRGGYGLETSPVPSSQPGVTNLLDGPKHTLAAGAGLPIAAFGRDRRVRLDVHGQVQIVGRRTLRKTVAAPGEDPAPFDALQDEVKDEPTEPDSLGVQISNPGYPSLRSGGAVYSAGVTLEVAL